MHINSSKSTMRSPIILSCVAALLILAIVPGNARALTQDEERQRAMKRDIELGLLAVEPPVKADYAVAFDSVVIIDQGEDDRDHLHHSHHHSQRDFPGQPLRKPERKILREPEEDLDHLYHR